MEFGEKIKTARLKKGLTQEQVAQELYISRQAVSNWESGKNYPDLETLCLLSDLYQISLDTLLKGDKKMIEKVTRKIEGNIVKKYVGVGVLILGIIAILICGIVDLSLNRSFSWSLLVFVCVVYLEIILQTVFTSKTRLTKDIGIVITIFTPILLVAIQYILIRLDPALPIWIWNIGLPLTFTWVTLFWCGYVIQSKKTLNIYMLLSMVSVLGIIGNIITNLIIYQVTSDFEANIVNGGIITIVHLVIGILLSLKGLQLKNIEK